MLSGGLGSSRYVQDRLRAEFNDELWGRVTGAPLLTVSTDPALCVAQGLVFDAIQREERDFPIGDKLPSPSGYGVVLRLKASKLDASAPARKLDEKWWDSKAYKRVNWIIEPVSTCSPFVPGP